MAVTKIWPVRGDLGRPINYVVDHEKTENPRYCRNDLQALTDVIEYAADSEKTDRRFFVSAINCNVTCARDQFMIVKKKYDKEGGIVAFHAYQSFAAGEVTPEQCHDIGVAMAKELWGDRFQVVVTTHLNTDCFHNHFVLNSVSYKDGKRYRGSLTTYKEMREVSDRLCRENGLSVVENPYEKETEPIYTAQQSKAGAPTRYNLAKAAIDEAIMMSSDMYDFEYNLKQMGYVTQFDEKRKYWTVIPKGFKKPIRLAKLGPEYTNERIYERVMSNDVQVRFIAFYSIIEQSRQYKLESRKDKIKRAKGLRGLYLRYCYELGYLPKYTQNPNRVHYLLKDELMYCEKYSQQARILGKNNIGTMEELISYRHDKEILLTQLISDREQLHKEKRRAIPDDMKQQKKEQITALTERIKDLRKEIKLCTDIEERSPLIEEKLRWIEEERNKERSER